MYPVCTDVTSNKRLERAGEQQCATAYGTRPAAQPQRYYSPQKHFFLG
jgi:hypothetical protein